MAERNAVPTNTNDMRGLHQAFRRGLSESRRQIEAVVGDDAGARRVRAYLADLLWMLHAHHEGEDELLYPLLVARVPEEQALFDSMDAQHRGVTDSLRRAEEANERFGESASAEDASALANALDTLYDVLLGHLDDEESTILSLAADWITPEEWGRLPGHAMASYRGERLWMPFGLAMEGMPPGQFEVISGELPPPVLAMWLGGGADAFAAEMAAIRQEV